MWVWVVIMMVIYLIVFRLVFFVMLYISFLLLILKFDELFFDIGEDFDEDGYNYGGYSYGGYVRMIDNFFVEILCGVSVGCIVWDFVNGIFNGFDYDDYVYFGYVIWWLV